MTLHMLMLDMSPPLPLGMVHAWCGRMVSAEDATDRGLSDCKSCERSYQAAVRRMFPEDEAPTMQDVS